MPGADVLRSEPTGHAEKGEPVALVLGAGGARGLAQIGVIEALLERGLRIVAVAGSSSGALVGGLFAAGKMGVYRDWLYSMSRTDMLRLLDPVFGQPALFRGDRLMHALRELIGEPRIEELPVQFTAVAVDLLRQREVWLREGDLWDAIRASIAIPGVFTPYELHGRELVDGGLLAPLPITATRLSDAHRLIAVDMHGWPDQPTGALGHHAGGDGRHAPVPVSQIASIKPPPLTRWFRRNQPVAIDPPDDAPPHELSFSELMARSLDTMQAQIARVQLALDPPELVIRIPRDACQFYEFWRAKELIALGREQAEIALDKAGY
ncbi:patatin-like phospholipase family protein [Lysobacter sp. K5869]|uniref:patatin-like phospholipase family protein n=1 Tax=Lysobacter sp. K5869 TaxID=2820808 RepID=UPI001C064797|nr:patatin-like phospholipase family protein [Lysobacter sp. K5869]QWP78284.1 patatin-like phospholipase family protein [Lysobacter sp. K5869]